MLRRTLVAALALFAGTAAQAEWMKASSRHFVVYSDDRPEAVKTYAQRLERFDAAIRSVLALKTPEVSPSARVHVFVVPGVSDIQRLSGVSNAAGFYRNDFASEVDAFIPRRAGEGDERSLTPQEVMLHEYTHHIMYSSFEGIAVPTWFSEGFAELFATAKFASDGGVTFGAPPLYRAYGIDKSNIVPIERLVRRGPDYHDGLQAQVFYGRAWLLTDYLMFDRDRSKQLAAYIVAINSGKTPEQATQVLGVTSSLDLKLDGYAHRTQWPAATIPAEKAVSEEVTVSPLDAGERAMMPALIRSRNGVDPRQAQLVIADARRLAAPYPSDPAAQNELAEAEYDAGNFAASEAAADRALVADPRSVHALIYKGNARIAQLKKAGSKDQAAWTTARRYFLAANKIEPLYSYPPQLYYESFAAAGTAAPTSAGDGLLWAYRLRPDLYGLRLEAAAVLLERGDKEAAHVALEPLADSAHGGSGVDLARKTLTALDADGTQAALGVLKHASDATPDDKKS